MHIEAILNSVTEQGQATVPEGWGQGRAAFGGLLAALLYQHAAITVAKDQVLRSFSLSFVAPVAPGSLSIHSEVLRQGKSVLQVQVTARQAQQVAAVMLLSFGAARPSELHVPAAAAPAMKTPQYSQILPFIKGMTPDFLAHIELAWAQGDMPFTGSETPDFAGHMRYREPLSATSIAAFIGLVDAWPPSLLPMFKRPAPASSLTWTMELVGDPTPYAGDSWWQYQVITDHCADGYGQSRASVWSPDGQLMALSRQTVTVFT